MWRTNASEFKEVDFLVRSNRTIFRRTYGNISLSFLFLLLFLPLGSTTSIGCSGIYRANRGVIQTYNFPQWFETPIECEWVIDASNSTLSSHITPSLNNGNKTLTSRSGSNKRIVVYLTQVYVLSGLSFTEYFHYNCKDGAYNDGGKEIYVFFNSTYVESFAKFLVIRFHLDTVVGTHLRVQNKFLDVYGFNITYEITSVIREKTCKMSTCGFTGYCYDNFEKFFCDCLPGFEGISCSDGPKSLCVRNGVSACREDRICKHVGETAITCENYALKKAKLKSQPELALNYTFAKNYKHICGWPKLLHKKHNPQNVGYSGKLFVKNITASHLDNLILESSLNKEITQTLQVCNATTSNLIINKAEKVQIKEDVHVNFHFLGFRKDKHQLRKCFRNFADNTFGTIKSIEGNVTLDVEPTLILNNLTMNKIQPIHEGEEFILSCMATGSPNMAFRWYKDNMFINITTPIKSNKWIQLVQHEIGENNKGGTYSSLLVVSDVKELDEGRFTCQVTDNGRQECATQQVQVSMAPTIYIYPKSLAVKQDQQFNIICQGIWTKDDSCDFDWLENGRQLPNNAEIESLYPMGSWLKIPGINEITNYTCTCKSEGIFKEDTITVYVYNFEKEIPCKADNKTINNLVYWVDTPPNIVSIVGCPENYTGIVTRMCESSTKPVDPGLFNVEKIRGEWALPDYSGCLHEELAYIKSNFETLELGYNYTTVLKIINGYKNHVLNLDKYILPSEGKRIFMLLRDVLEYIVNSKNLNNIRKITNAILDITDVLLSNANAIYTKNDIILMQKVVKISLILFANGLNETRALTRKQFNITINTCNNATAERLETQKLICVHYFKLMPKMLKFTSDSDLDYKLISDVRSIWMLSDKVDDKHNLTVNVNITNWTMQQLNNNLNKEWRIECAVSKWGFDWNTNGCSTIIDLPRHVARCRCGKDGTFAVLYVKKAKTNNQNRIETTQILIYLLYAITLLLSVVSVILSLIQMHSSKTAASFLDSHSAVSKLIICGIFVIGSLWNFAQEMYLYILSTIMFSYFIAMSSQLSVLMITYIELEDILHKEKAKIAIVEIFILGAILVSIGNYIAHTSMVLQTPYWWIKMADTLSFNVFIICTILIVILFFVLYWIVWNLMKKEMGLGCMFIYKKYNKIKKCAYVFCAILFNIIVSISYINHLKNNVLHYLLTFTFILIDFTIIISIAHFQNFHFQEIVSKLKNRSRNKKGTSSKSILTINEN